MAFDSRKFLANAALAALVWVGVLLSTGASAQTPTPSTDKAATQRRALIIADVNKRMRTCRRQADRQGLHLDARRAFIRKCLRK